MTASIAGCPGHALIMDRIRGASTTAQKKSAAMNAALSAEEMCKPLLDLGEFGVELFQLLVGDLVGRVALHINEREVVALDQVGVAG